jgi:lysophospholipase L1-like esterase
MRKSLLALAAACLLATPLMAADQYTTTAPLDRLSNADWAKTHQQYCDLAKTNPPVVFLGDSITQLWRNDDRGKAAWAAHFAPLGAVNFGYSADRIQNILWRVEHGEMPAGMHPKVVVLLAGTNNIWENNPDQIHDGMAALIHEILTRSPDTQILLLAVFPRGEKPDSNERPPVAAMNARLATLDDGKHVFWLDIGKTFVQSDGVISKDILTDFLHPSVTGYGLFADAIEPTLTKLLKAQ